MGKRWAYQGFVDAHLELDDETQREVERRMNAYAAKLPAFNWTLLIMSGGVIPLVIFGTDPWAGWLRATFGWSTQLAGVVAALSLSFIWIGGCLAIFMKIYVPALRRALRDVGYEICVSCGYWMRGIADDSTKCPECGSERQPMHVPPQGSDN